MFDKAKVRDRIREVAIAEGELSPEAARDVAFHLTDWLSELTTFSEFCHDPSAQSSDEINTLLIAFLIHAPNHIAAAAKLYIDTPTTDIFGVGAVDAVSDILSDD